MRLSWRRFLSKRVGVKCRANALENAVAIYDVRCINNVRVAQIFRIINACWDSFKAIIMMTANCHDFYTYKRWYQEHFLCWWTSLKCVCPGVKWKEEKTSPVSSSRLFPGTRTTIVTSAAVLAFRFTPLCNYARIQLHHVPLASASLPRAGRANSAIVHKQTPSASFHSNLCIFACS